jgi:hypothetical protein
MSKQTLDDWSAIIDFSSLRNLKFSRGIIDSTYFVHAAHMLPNLQHISLNFRYLQDVSEGEKNDITSAAHQYLISCTPVKSLSLWSWMDVISLKDILTRHGETLTSLQLHERENASDSSPRKILDCEDIKSITDVCFNLKDLTFDLNRTSSALKLDDTDANMEYIRILSKIGTRLSSLQIYFDVGSAYLATHPGYDGGAFASSADIQSGDEGSSSDEDQGDHDGVHAIPRRSYKPIAPTIESVMSLYVQDIWKAVFGIQRAGKRVLTVKVGEWETIRNHLIVRAPMIGFRQQLHLIRQFVVKPMERDDQYDQCSVKIMSA